MKLNINNAETRMRLQGEKLLVRGIESKPKEGLVLTFVQLADIDSRKLILVNREEKSREVTELSQAMVDKMVPLENDPRAKWLLIV